MSQSSSDDTIFAGALCLPAEERAAYIEQATRGDAALRQRVERLLKGYEAAEFLEEPVAARNEKTIAIGVPFTEKPGDRIGRYKLLQQIGEGGCGVVYMAEQEEPVRRRVALKVIKLGMDTKSVIARFEAERQALALMDHPNIAKVFDAGATETGRPYFVMELVRGMKITDYCDETKLSIRARLDLFMQVCRAVQHAHQKGVIHRDIKPSNIMVTINDGVPVPKVIDFGIAKATTGQQLTDKTLFTAFEQFLGTPAYMSPEQAVLTSLDIDTRSDIYALGVLLYEMLTGKTPFAAEELLAIGLDEMRRTIREKEPERPSTRLSTLPDNDLSTMAQRRAVKAPTLVSELRGDLDWIVMKCLEKDRVRRYDTANGLAADIQRHLSNEPVVACPPSHLYRFAKMVRRNKLAFAAASAVALSLVIGLVACAALLTKERTALRQADEQAAIAKAVKDFLQSDLLKQADIWDQVDRGFAPNPNLTVKEAMVRASEKIGQRFASQPLVEAEVRQTLGIAFQGLGEPNSAIPQFERAVTLYTQAVGLEDRRTLGVMFRLANVYHDASQPTQAAALWRKTLKLQKATLGPNDPDTLRTTTRVAGRMTWSGQSRDVEAAISLYKQTLGLQISRLGQDHPDTLETMRWLSFAYDSHSQPEQALQLREQILRLTTGRFGSSHPATVAAMVRVADSYLDAGRPREAIKILTEALRLSESSLDRFYSGHPGAITIRFLLADAYRDAGELDDARRIQHDILTRALAAQPQNRDQLLWREQVLVWLGHWKEAAADASRIIDLNDDDIWAWNRLGVALVEAGELDSYRDRCAKALNRFGKTTDPCAALCVAEDCLVLPSSGADLETVAKLADVAASDPTNHWAWSRCQLCKGLSEYRLGRFMNAVGFAQLALTRPPEESDWGVNRVRFENRGVQAKAVLAMACWQLKQTNAARSALGKSMEIAKAVQHKREGISLGGDWQEWLFAQASLREATALIEGGSPARAETK